jgi:hypothetical protein
MTGSQASGQQSKLASSAWSSQG